MVSEAGAFLVHGGIEHHFQEKTSDSFRIAVDRYFSEASLV